VRSRAEPPFPDIGARLSPGSVSPWSGARREARTSSKRTHSREELLQTLRRVAPGTKLRAGMDSILRGRTGALIVVGDTPEVMATLDGGFKVDAAFTPAALYELSKMDGGIVLSSDASRILYANVQLNPDPSSPSEETGIRHRTAERMARQTGQLVIAVSSRRSVITIYKGHLKYSLGDIGFILEKAGELVEVLERYRHELDRVLALLTALEFEDLVTVGDVAAVLERADMVLAAGEEMEAYTAELGTEGRHLAGWVHELAPVQSGALLVIRDYCRQAREGQAEDILVRLRSMSKGDPVPLEDIARLLGYSGAEAGLAAPVTPRGYRILCSIPRLPANVAENVVTRFENLQRILAATLDELDEVDGIGEVRARVLKDTLRRMREQNLLSRRGD